MNGQVAGRRARVRRLVWRSLLVPVIPLVLVACGQKAESSSGTASRTAASAATGNAAPAMHFSGPAVWAINGSAVDTRLYRIDPQAGKVVGSVELPGLPRGVAAGEGAVWVTDYSDDKVIEVNPSSLQIESTLDVADAPTFVTTGAGTVWVISSNDGVLTAIDSASAAIRDTLKITNSFLSGVVYGAGAVWVPSVDFQVAKVNPQPLKVATTIRVVGNPSSGAVVDGHVWVLNIGYRQAVRIDPATNKTTVFDMKGSLRFLYSDGQTLWMVLGGGTVEQLNTSTGKPAGSFKVAGDISGMCGTAKTLWVSVDSANDVLAVDPKTGQTSMTVPVPGGPIGLACGA